MDTSKRHIRPVEGEWFDVEPYRINRKLFEDDRQDKEQQFTLGNIRKAFQWLDSSPYENGRPFKILIPKKTWGTITIREMLDITKTFGGNMSTGFETDFLWAQIINNGETWENLCNKPDTLNYYRLVNWGKENSVIFLTGGALKGSINYSATHVETLRSLSLDAVPSKAVPQITCYVA